VICQATLRWPCLERRGISSRAAMQPRLCGGVSNHSDDREDLRDAVAAPVAEHGRRKYPECQPIQARINRKMRPGWAVGENMDIFSLANEKAIVTRGGSGLGAAIAKCLVLAGAQVVICGRRIAVLRETCARLGGDSRSRAPNDLRGPLACRHGPCAGLHPGGIETDVRRKDSRIANGT